MTPITTSCGRGCDVQQLARRPPPDWLKVFLYGYIAFIALAVLHTFTR